MIAIFFLFLLIVSAISLVWTTFRVGISPMPTSKKVREGLEAVLPFVEGEIVELGSGFGHLAIFLSKKYPRCNVYGYEVSWVPYWVSVFGKSFLRRKNLVLQRKDFYRISLENSSLVVCYLFPKAMEKLKSKFLDEMAKGSYVLSHTFAIRGWEPIQTLEANDLARTKIYLYRI